MNWREIGASCGFADTESDDLVHKLAAEKIVLLDDPNKHSFALLAGYLVDEVDATERERRWRRVELAVVAVSVLMTLLYLALRRTG